MNARHDLIAYLATLVTLVVVFIGALIAAGLSEHVSGKIEAFGLGTIVGGLIGILRIPNARQVSSTETGDVNVTQGKEAP